MRAAISPTVLRLLLAVMPVVAPALHRESHACTSHATTPISTAGIEAAPALAPGDSESCEFCALFVVGLTATPAAEMVAAAAPITAAAYAEQVVRIRRSFAPDSPRAPPR